MGTLRIMQGIRSLYMGVLRPTGHEEVDRTMLDRTQEDWWKDAVFYQIYPRSFQDTSGNGIGDIRGITSRLDYLADLGVDGIWLSPVYASPQRDNGYDVSDYRAIDPLFGSMEDMEELIREAERRGIIILMDIIANHTSEEHPWFEEAKSSKDSPMHDFYIWRDGTADAPPDSSTALFGGPAWTYVPELGQYYYHNFSPFQPDLNWKNPEVRDAIYDIIRFWLDKGVGGFRMDAIGYIGKDLDHGIRQEGPMLHPYLREMRREAFPDPRIVVVGEAMETRLEQAYEFVNPDGSEFSLIFQGDEMDLDNVDWDEYKWTAPKPALSQVKKFWRRWQNGLYGRGWNTLYMNNHDEPRDIGIWGDEGEYRVQSAKMLAAMQYLMQGTPFIYQGEELGMTNAQIPLEAYQDVESVNFIRRQREQGRRDTEIEQALQNVSRDNARTPMQWTNGPQAGFTTGTPWLPINPNYMKINAEAQTKDPNSVYAFYKELLALRKRLPVFRDGTFTLLDEDNEATFCYTRDAADAHVLVQCNLSAEEQPVPFPDTFDGGELLLGNYPSADGPLRPFETRVLLARSVPR